MPESSAPVAAAMACLDAFMAAFNARDVKAFEATFNFPSIRLASNTLAIIEPGYHKPGMFEQGALKDWDHSAWERRADLACLALEDRATFAAALDATRS